jgi:RNA polymerase sigma-70 factor (ECF subfamily)
VDLLVLHRPLDSLEERQRETVILFEISGLSLEEIRAIQGGSLSGVKSRLVRGRQRLAEVMSDPVPTPTTNGSSGLIPNTLERTQLAYLLKEKV